MKKRFGIICVVLAGVSFFLLNGCGIAQMYRTNWTMSTIYNDPAHEYALSDFEILSGSKYLSIKNISDIDIQVKLEQQYEVDDSEMNEYSHLGSFDLTVGEEILVENVNEGRPYKVCVRPFENTISEIKVYIHSEII